MHRQSEKRKTKDLSSKNETLAATINVTEDCQKEIERKRHENLKSKVEPDDTYEQGIFVAPDFIPIKIEPSLSAGVDNASTACSLSRLSDEDASEADRAMQCEKDVCDDDIWIALKHVILWFNSLPSPKFFSNEDEVRRAIYLDCGVLGIEAKYLHAIAVIANEFGVLQFAYSQTTTNSDFYRRKIQCGVRWVRSRLERGYTDRKTLIQEMTDECRIINFSDYEMRIIVYLILQILPKGTVLPRWLTRPRSTTIFERTSNSSMDSRNKTCSHSSSNDFRCKKRKNTDSTDD